MHYAKQNTLNKSFTSFTRLSLIIYITYLISYKYSISCLPDVWLDIYHNSVAINNICNFKATNHHEKESYLCIFYIITCSTIIVDDSLWMAVKSLPKCYNILSMHISLARRAANYLNSIRGLISHKISVIASWNAWWSQTFDRQCIHLRSLCMYAFTYLYTYTQSRQILLHRWSIVYGQ